MRQARLYSNTPGCSVMFIRAERSDTYLIWHWEYPDSHLLILRVCSSWILDFIIKFRMKKKEVLFLFLSLADRDNQKRETRSTFFPWSLHQQRWDRQVNVPSCPTWQISDRRPPKLRNTFAHYISDNLRLLDVQGRRAQDCSPLRDSDRLTTTAVLQPVCKVGDGGVKTMPGAHPTVPNR